MKTEFTPGPWDALRNRIEIQSNEDRHEVHAYVDGVPVPVAQVWPAMHVEHDDPVSEYQISEAEGLANLRLIAAAPELFAVLKSFLAATEGTACVSAFDAHGIDVWPNLAKVGRDAREALAKATGKD